MFKLPQKERNGDVSWLIKPFTITYKMVLHIPHVSTPKYRRKDLKKIIKEPCRYKGVEIVEGHFMPDHVHLLLEIPLKLSVSSFMMFDRHANLKYKFGNRHFWSEGFYVSTVGLNTATVEKYIREQEMHDQMVDKLSVKEYGDPFSNATKRKRSEKGITKDKKTK